MQRELDERIEKEHPIQPGEDRLAKKILALQVELGECANEWRGFKFWSKNQKPRVEGPKGCVDCSGRGFEMYGEANSLNTRVCRKCNGSGVYGKVNPLLEEYVDCLHFILSIGIQLGHDESIMTGAEWITNPKPMSKHIVGRFTLLMGGVGDSVQLESYYRNILWYFIDLGYMLGFTTKQIEQAYHHKYEINLQRQASGY
jgi:dimeric dUTPase (all-alpha-NTP-PPase superfamily)